jgi:hypothetical protein
MASMGSSRGEPAQPRRALEGQHAAEAQLEAQIEIAPRLLQAAVEGVRDAADAPAASRSSRSMSSWALRTCSSTGRPAVAGDGELRRAEPALALGVERGIMAIIEPDLADGEVRRCRAQYSPRPDARQGAPSLGLHPRAEGRAARCADERSAAPVDRARSRHRHLNS